MKKIAISGMLVLAALGVVSASEGTSSEQMPPLLPPMMTTGSSTLDAQIKTLRQGYETQIKALREEYMTKLKALVGDKKMMMGTSTRPMMKDGKNEEKDGKGHMMGSGSSTMMMGDRKPMQQGERHEMKQGEVEGVSTEMPQDSNLPQGNVVWGFFKKFLGGN